MKFKDLKIGEYYAYENLTTKNQEAGKIIRVISVDLEQCFLNYSIKGEGNFVYFVKSLEESLPIIKSTLRAGGIVGKDMVNHPNHYNKGEYEVIDVIEDWGLDFSLGNAIKYIARCNHKGNKKQDLEKAIFYLKRELKKEE